MTDTYTEVGARYAVPTPLRRIFALNLLGLAIIACQPGLGIEPRPPATPAVDSTSGCDITPRSPEDIAALLASPDIATPAAATGGQTLPAGALVSVKTKETIESVVRAWLACQNAGEPLRAWALFSDGYLYRLLIRQGARLDIAPAASTPESVADGGAMLLEIRDARELPDGRLGATVVIAYPSVPMPKTFFFAFIDADGRLLIDGILGEISFSVP